MSHFGTIDWVILVTYFCALAAMGPIFARVNKNTDTFFLGNRSFPAWLLGLAMFATSISSMTVMAYPADAYKTAYLRLLPAFMLPVGIFIASKVFLPYFRKARCTSAFEYLEGRFGPGVRLYAAIAFLIGQVLRIATILYLISMLFQQMTGATPYMCILVGGIVIAIYTVSGGIKAVVWTQFFQTFLLWLGAFLCIYSVLKGIEGGIPEVFRTAFADGKFQLGDLNSASGKIESSPWFSIQQKSVILILLVGLVNWLYEYSSNQNVIQKYASAKNPKEATKAIWICCFCSVPTWTFFMFLGTALYVYFKQHPDPTATAILTGTGGYKAEAILPFFCVNHLPTGIKGLVITGVFAAAMSASSSSVNAISAVTVTDIYRRHMVKNGSDRHYMWAARLVSGASALIMMGGAALFLEMNTLTLQDLGTKMAAIVAGGLFGLYALGFLTTRGNGKTVFAAIICTVFFSVYITLIEAKVITVAMYAGMGLSESVAKVLANPFHSYYTGIVGNIVMFFVGYIVASLFQREKRDLTNLTVWTGAGTPEEA
jgi:SSS family solute:Na+ symporter